MVSEKRITATDGTTFDVTEVVSDNTDVVIIKKDGVIIERQITEQNKVRYEILMVMYFISHQRFSLCSNLYEDDRQNSYFKI